LSFPSRCFDKYFMCICFLPWIDTIKMDLLEIGLSVVDRIGLAQDRYRWRALVNSVMNFGFYKMLGIYRMAAHLVASRAVLSSTELVFFHTQKLMQRTHEFLHAAILCSLALFPPYEVSSEPSPLTLSVSVLIWAWYITLDMANTKFWKPDLSMKVSSNRA
jgi:hypothetical protein